MLVLEGHSGTFMLVLAGHEVSKTKNRLCPAALNLECTILSGSEFEMVNLFGTFFCLNSLWHRRALTRDLAARKRYVATQARGEPLAQGRVSL
jgi:hypothetical protein